MAKGNSKKKEESSDEEEFEVEKILQHKGKVSNLTASLPPPTLDS